MPFHRKHSPPGRIRTVTLLLAVIAGCGPQPISGGTPGVLTTDGNPLRDVQLTVYAAEAPQRLGYAVTTADGSFSLIADDSNGPLELPPGSYLVTLESLGVPADLPRDYLDRATTPLKVDWTDGNRLRLNVPGLKLK